MTTIIDTDRLNRILSKCEMPNTVETGLCLTNILALADDYTSDFGYDSIIDAANDRFTGYCVYDENIASVRYIAFRAAHNGDARFAHQFKVGIRPSGYYTIDANPGLLNNHADITAFTKALNAIAEWCNAEQKRLEAQA